MTSYFLNLRTRVLHTEDCPHKPKNGKRVLMVPAPWKGVNDWLKQHPGVSFDPRCRATQEEGQAA